MCHDTWGGVGCGYSGCGCPIGSYELHFFAARTEKIIIRGSYTKPATPLLCSVWSAHTIRSEIPVQPTTSLIRHAGLITGAPPWPSPSFHYHQEEHCPHRHKHGVEREVRIFVHTLVTPTQEVYDYTHQSRNCDTGRVEVHPREIEGHGFPCKREDSVCGKNKTKQKDNLVI